MSRHKLLLVVAAAILTSGIAGAGEIYKWTDADGNVHYGDRPIGDGVVERVAISSRNTNSAKVADRVQAHDELQTSRNEAKAKKAEKGANKKELRRQRAEMVAARSKALGSLQKQIDKLEDAIVQLEGKLEDAKARQKALLARHKTASSRLAARKKIYDYKIDDAMIRFEQYTRRIDDVEGRVEAYDLGLPKDLNHEFAGLEAEETVKKELEELKQRVANESKKVAEG